MVEVVVGVGGSVATMRGERLTVAEENGRTASGVQGRKAAESGMAGRLIVKLLGMITEEWSSRQRERYWTGFLLFYYATGYGTEQRRTRSC